MTWFTSYLHLKAWRFVFSFDWAMSVNSDSQNSAVSKGKKSINHYYCHSLLGCCLWFSILYQTQSGLHCLVCETCTKGLQPASYQSLWAVSMCQHHNHSTLPEHSSSSVALVKPFSPETVLPFNVCQQTSHPFLMYTVSESLDGSNLSFLCQGNHHT